MNCSVVGFVLARGGSKGVPRKNVRLLAGKPLIAWTIEAALQSRGLTRVLVSTDDAEIAEVSRAWGAEVPWMRPAELARDDSPHVDALLHMLRWLEQEEGTPPDYVMSLQPTSPLRTAEDIDGAIALGESSGTDAVVSVCESSEHPFLAKTISEDGMIRDCGPKGPGYLRRQSFPQTFVLNGAVYLNRRQSLWRDRTMFPERTMAYVMPASRSLDIDTPWDFYLADLIMRDNYGRRSA